MHTPRRMTDLKIKVRDRIYLSGVSRADKPALLEHLQIKDIHDRTMNIPYPYSGADADWWLRKRIEHTNRYGRESTFAIRDAGKLIGVVGTDNFELGMTHRAEIGYWLARPYWGHDVMTDAVRTFVRYAFAELEVVRLTAHVFTFNVASARVLEKNGFKLEGCLRKHFCKDGQLIDARFYGLLKEELS
jgi:ribosomal-protein-alanine N-acetyltransferase